MAGIPADGALDPDAAPPGAPQGSGTAEALGTLKGPVAPVGAEGTVLLLLEGAVQQGQLAQLGLLVDVLLVVDDDQHVLEEFGRLVELGGVVTGNQHVEGIVAPLLQGRAGPSLGPLLDAALAPDGNLAPRPGLQLLLGLAPRSDDEPYKIVVGMLLDGDPDLAGALPPLPSRRPHGGVEVHHLFQ